MIVDESSNSHSCFNTNYLSLLSMLSLMLNVQNLHGSFNQLTKHKIVLKFLGGGLRRRVSCFVYINDEIFKNDTTAIWRTFGYQRMLLSGSTLRILMTS